jgi:hypothetical protein
VLIFYLRLKYNNNNSIGSIFKLEKKVWFSVPIPTTLPYKPLILNENEFLNSEFSYV